MARRKAKLDLTLFPFLSVLCGLIAVMVLFMIVTISTRVISTTAEASGGAPAAPGPDRPEEGIAGDDYRRLDARVMELEKILAERMEAREELRLQLQSLAALVEAAKLARETAPADQPAGVRLGEPTPVKMIPFRDPNASNKTPVFIEVSSTGFVVHPEKTTFPLLPTKGKEPGGRAGGVPPELGKLFDEMARGGGRYPLLLVHSHGVEAFHAVLDYHAGLRRRTPGLELSIGWEPFAREWLLDQK